jgi:hypothetical protein
VKRWAIWGALAVATACGGKHALRAFEPEWQNDGGASIARLQARLQATSLPVGAAVAVGVTGSGLIGIGLDGSGRWAYAGPVDARPTIAGDVVVLTGGGQVVALFPAPDHPPNLFRYFFYLCERCSDLKLKWSKRKTNQGSH